MNKRNTFWVHFLLFLFIATQLTTCLHPTHEVLSPELIEAEALLLRRPDSALIYMEKMPVPSPSQRLEHATWALMLTRARYVNYVDIPNDSLINIAYHYFIKRDDPERKALVLYMQALLNTEWGNADIATEYLLKAAAEIEKTNDYALGYSIYLKLGNIYAYRSLYEYTEDAFTRSIEYAKLTANNLYEANAYKNMGRAYMLLKRSDDAINMYKKAIEAARLTTNKNTLASAYNELAGIYTELEKYDDALLYNCLALDISLQIGKNIDKAYFVRGNIYRNLEKNDSAYYYLNKSLNTTQNIYTKRGALLSLYEMSKALRKYPEAIVWGDQTMELSDSIHKIERTTALIEMQEKYSQEKVLNEKNKLQIEKDQITRRALSGLLIILCVIAIMIYIYQRKLIRKQQTICEHEERIRKYRLRIHENESVIGRNRNRISELQLEMEKNKEVNELLEEQQRAISEIQHRNELLSNENKMLAENVSLYSTTLQQKTEELDALTELTHENRQLRERERYLRDQLEAEMRVLKELKTQPKYVDDSRWEEVYKAINRLYDNFTERIVREIPSLTESDIQICCLVKLRLPISDIATLLAISPTSVSRRKVRLKERIIQELGDPFRENNTLDTWLWEY